MVPWKGRAPAEVDPVAQLVEHRTFNAVVASSSLARVTILSTIGLHRRALRRQRCLLRGHYAKDFICSINFRLHVALALVDQRLKDDGNLFGNRGHN